LVFHLAANSDIALSRDNPAIDLNNTFLTTYNVLCCMKDYGVKKIIAVNVLPAPEDHAQRRDFIEAQLREQGREAEKKTAVDRFIYFLGKVIRNRFRDNVFNVLMNTIQFLE